jgi:BirA family biotin operon repressor/biotin-[acetyl-CoA-carboxylase] ligase
MGILNQNLVELVELLGDGEYHNGTDIGRHLGVSRAAVWKLVKKLELYNVPFVCTKGKGYRLEVPLALLNADKMKSLLHHHSATKVVVLEKTSSTNDYLKSVSKNNKDIIACFAEAQTAGKGRLQRQWYSPFAENIYLSLLYPFEKDMSELGGLSLVIALAICDALESVVDLGEKKLSVKWPNDILIDGCKLAGILIEIEAESNGLCQLIIGIGINVNMRKAFKKDIDQNWVSLLKMTNQTIDRNLIGSKVIDVLIDYIEEFSSTGLTGFKKEWQKRDCLAGGVVSVVSGSNKVSGACLGINTQGHLKIKTKKGDVLAVSSGDSTLQK